MASQLLGKNSLNKPNLRQHKKNPHTQKTQAEKNKLPWLTRQGNGVAYSIQAPGPQGPSYWLAGLPVSCRQVTLVLVAAAGKINFKIR